MSAYGLNVCYRHMEETDPDIDLAVSDTIAKRSDVELHDCDDGDDVLMGGKVYNVVGLRDAEEGELRVRYVCEQPKHILGIQLKSMCQYRQHD